MFMGIRDEGLTVVLPLATALNVDGIHFSPASWTAKKGNALGRPIMDSSSNECGLPLNSKEAAEAGELLWGKIEHPTLATYDPSYAC
jgi:hypothetical protein